MPRTKSERTRRDYTVLDEQQFEILEGGYAQDHYPDNRAKRALASATGLAFLTVSIWFENRRREKRQSRKAERQQPDELQSLSPEHIVSSILCELKTNRSYFAHIKKKSIYDKPDPVSVPVASDFCAGNNTPVALSRSAIGGQGKKSIYDPPNPPQPPITRNADQTMDLSELVRNSLFRPITSGGKVHTDLANIIELDL